MFIVVKFGGSEIALFNSECRIVSLLEEIKCKCKLDPWAEIELSDDKGNPKCLREHLHRYASDLLRDKEVYVLLQVDNDTGGVKYTPLLEDTELLSEEFMERLTAVRNKQTDRLTSQTEKRQQKSARKRTSKK